MFGRRSLTFWLITIAAVFTAVTGAFLGERIALAQGEERDYVDVGLILEVPDHVGTSASRFLNVIVVNHGERVAYDVEVVVNIEYPEDSSYFWPPHDYETIGQLLDVPIGSVSHGDDRYSLKWSIPALGGLQRETLEVKGVRHESVTGDAVQFDKVLYVHGFSGKVSTSSFESKLHTGNNTDRVWSYKSNDGTTTYNFYQVSGNYSVAVSVDNASPSPGETVEFKVETTREALYTLVGVVPPPIDLKVAIELTDGLSVDEDPDATPAREITYSPASVDSLSYDKDTGVFNVGTLKTGDGWTQSVTLPITVASDAVVNQQCLTATLNGNPPPGIGPYDDDISDNMAKLCLGAQPVEPLASGQVDAFTVYPCVGITDAPCDSANDVRVRAVKPTGHIVTLGSALFHVDPLKARIYDDHENSSNVLQSVNDGNTVSWQTAVSAGRPYIDGLASGVELYYSRTPFVDNTSGWGGLSFGISARDVDGNIPPPGKVFLRSTSSGNEVRKAESPNYEELRTTATSISTSRLNYFLEFEKLGTYRVSWHAVAKRSSLHGSENCNPDSSNVNQIFCGTETYTFHVGPIAELEVRDGGASGHAAADQSALTIVAVNNGPDPASGAQVNGLPTGAEVLYKSPPSSSYDGTTGVWDIGELRLRGYYQSRGEPDPTLVLSAPAGDTADVTITNATDYTVCIGSGGEDLDHNSQANCKADAATTNVWHAAVCVNTADNTIDTSITVEATCDGTTDRAWRENICAASGGAVIDDYDEMECDGWFQGTVYDYNTDNSTATITAVAGTGGGGEGAPTVQSANDPGSSITVTWDAIETVNGLPVTHYEIQRSQSPWTTLHKKVAGTEYIDTGVGPGLTYQYRVRAVNEADVSGPWSAPMEGTAADSGGGGTQIVYVGGGTTTVEVEVRPEGPTGVKAIADGETAIVLTWSGPNRLYGAAVDYYEVEASPDGAIWTTLAPRVTETTYTHEGLWAGNTCRYRVYAHNAEGRSLKSAVASGATADGDNLLSEPCVLAEPARPEGPTELEAIADGETAIVLTWTGPDRLYGAPVDYYEVEASEGGTIWTTLAPRVAETTYTHESLEAGDTRHYRVFARNGEGRSPASAVTCGATDGALSTPCILSAEVDGNTVTVEWINAKSADGHQVLLMNLVDFSFYGYVEDLPADTTSHTFQDVPAGEYFAFVLAYTGTLEDFNDFTYDLEAVVVE